MRKIILLFALLSSAAAFGQTSDASFRPAAGREPGRPRMVPAPRFDLPDAASNTYLRAVEWSVADDASGRRYTADCSVPFAWANRQVILRIASVPAGYELTVNGRRAGSVHTGALPAEFNLTKYLKEGANRLELYVPNDAAARCLEDFAHPDAPGRSELISQPTIRVRDVLIATRPVENRYLAEIGIVVKSDALNRKQARIHYELVDTAGRAVKSGFEDIALSMRGEDTLRFVAHLEQSDLWEPDSPLRYTLRLRTQTAGRYTEYAAVPVGFRTIGHRDGVLRINGREAAIRLYETDRMLGAEELRRIKAEGYNLLWPAPGLFDETLFDLCDEIGLYVVAQAPLCTAGSGQSRRKGGNPANQPEWTQACIDRTEAAYHTAKRHPSVVAFSLARRSSNGIGLYESYLNLKRSEPQCPILYPEADGEWNNDPVCAIICESAN